jgi:hypothetical protein
MAKHTSLVGHGDIFEPDCSVEFGLRKLKLLCRDNFAVENELNSLIIGESEVIDRRLDINQFASIYGCWSTEVSNFKLGALRIKCDKRPLERVVCLTSHLIDRIKSV